MESKKSIPELFKHIDWICTGHFLKILETPEEWFHKEWDLGITTHKFHCHLHHIDFETEYDENKVESPGGLCPKCQEDFKSYVGVYGDSSIGEKELGDWLIQEGFEIERKNNTILNGRDIDIYIPEHHLAIEFNGVYWNSYSHNPDKKYHLNKTLECEKQGIQMLHIFDLEWEYKQDIIKSIILAKLHKFSNKIYARKCKTIKPNETEYKLFLNENHIQGWSSAQEKYALTYNNEIVCIASFSQSRWINGEWELVRLCSKQNTLIIGGFTKLLNCWSKKHPGEALISHCDRRISNAEGYINSGWKKIGEAPPQYQYFTQGSIKLLNRMKFQKKKMSKIRGFNYNPNLTEHQNMINNGYDWVYDCGTIKLEWIPTTK